MGFEGKVYNDSAKLKIPDSVAPSGFGVLHCRVLGFRI